MEQPDITFVAHLERGSETPFVWWIESPQAPGLYAAADGLEASMALAIESAREALGSLGEVRWELADTEVQTGPIVLPIPDPSEPVSESPVQARRIAVAA